MEGTLVSLQASEDSNLSDYGYDMVVATTQAAINATLKEYLYRMEAAEFIVYYKAIVTPVGTVDYVEANYQDLVTLVGMDLFSIPQDATKRTQAQNDALRKAYEEGEFAFAFKAKMGIFDLEELDKLPPIIELIESDVTSIANVKYKMFFDVFEIITLDEIRRQFVFSHLEQPKNAPWIFKFHVKLDLKSAEFNSLPEDIQKQIKNMDPYTMFSIQQLYLDLNSTSLQDMPAIEGLSPSSEAYFVLCRVFINTYFDQLRKSGGVIFGYTIAPSEPHYNETVIIKPTDFNFYISAYGADSEKKDLYTLNYIVMTDGHKMPEFKKFTWDWVDAEDAKNMHGSMAINRTAMAKLISDQLIVSMNGLLTQPKVDIDVNLIKASFKVWFEQYTAAKPGFELQNSGNPILKYSFSARDEDSEYYGNWGNINVKYNVDSKVSFEGNKIKCSTRVWAYLHVNIDGGVTEGNVVDYTLTDEFQLYVDEKGKLLFDHKLDKGEDKASIDGSTWAKIITFGGVNDVINSMKKYIKGKVDKYTANYSSQMSKALSNSLCWVFPGGTSFTYKDAKFSKKQDLIVDITYAKPD